MRKKIGLIDYGMGNLGSLINMIKVIGYDSNIVQTQAELEGADSIILPGVGSFDRAMTKLENYELIRYLKYLVLGEKKPILGICLGMQLMTRRSEEGKLDGLGLIDANVIKITSDLKNIKVPHMGWNNIHIKKDSKLLYKLNDDSRFYFVHSYKVVSENDSCVLTTTNYGDDFISSFEVDNIIGVQFHPEKSHKYGMQLLKNFLENY